MAAPVCFSEGWLLAERAVIRVIVYPSENVYGHRVKKQGAICLRFGVQPNQQGFLFGG